VDTIKADRSGEDLLIHILLDKALTLDLPIKSMKYKQNTVYIVGENDLIICVDPVLDISIVDDLAKLGADTAVFRDSSFANENDRIQLDTSFKTLSPRETKIIVI
jgi:adenine-specific DNA-methyltransferase